MNSEATSPFRRPGVIAGVAASRLYLFAMLYLLFVSTDLREDRNDFLFRKPGQTSEQREAEIRKSFWARLAPFDGQFYLDIANNGYRTISSSIHGDLGNYAFFPLMPAILAGLRLVAEAVYVPLTIAIVLVLSIVGTLGFWKLAERFGVNPLIATAVVICFPSAAFQHVLYTEGMFLCFSSFALLFTFERKPGHALIFALLAGLSRPQGVLLAIPIFLELVWPHVRPGSRDQREVPIRAVLAVAAPFAGFLVLAVSSKIVTGSPYAFLTVQGKWGRSYEAEGILRAIVSVFGYGGPPMDLLGVLVGVGCIPIMWKRLPRSLTFYGIAAVLMPLSTGSILSMARFMSVSIPHLLALGLFLQDRSTRLATVVLATFLVLQTLLARGLMGWYFVG